MFRKSTSGIGEEEKLLDSGQTLRVSSWSPDGKYILYSGGDAVWALPLAKDRKPFPVIQSTFYNGDGAFSPDGRWIAYVSNESGRGEVYVVPFPDVTDRWQVSTEGGASPHWRADGKEIIYGSGNRFMATEVSARGGEMVVGRTSALFGIEDGRDYDVARDGRLLVTIRTSQQSAPPTLVLNWPALGKR